MNLENVTGVSFKLFRAAGLNFQLYVCLNFREPDPNLSPAF